MFTYLLVLLVGSCALRNANTQNSVHRLEPHQVSGTETSLRSPYQAPTPENPTDGKEEEYEEISGNEIDNDYKEADFQDNRLRIMLQPKKSVPLNATTLKTWKAGEETSRKSITPQPNGASRRAMVHTQEKGNTYTQNELLAASATAVPGGKITEVKTTVKKSSTGKAQAKVFSIKETNEITSETSQEVNENFENISLFAAANKNGKKILIESQNVSNNNLSQIKGLGFVNFHVNSVGNFMSSNTTITKPLEILGSLKNVTQLSNNTESGQFAAVTVKKDTVKPNLLQKEDEKSNQTQVDTSKEKNDEKLSQAQADNPTENQNEKSNQTQVDNPTENQDEKSNQTQVDTSKEKDDGKLSQTQADNPTENQDEKSNQTQVDTSKKKDDGKLSQAQADNPTENQDEKSNGTQAVIPKQNADKKLNRTQGETPKQNNQEIIQDTQKSLGKPNNYNEQQVIVDMEKGLNGVGKELINTQNTPEFDDSSEKESCNGTSSEEDVLYEELEPDPTFEEDEIEYLSPQRVNGTKSGAIIIVLPDNGFDQMNMNASQKNVVPQNMFGSDVMAKNIFNLLVNLTAINAINERNGRKILEELQKQKVNLHHLRKQSDAIYRYIIKTKNNQPK